MALCPKCSENFIEGTGVISRRDNKTEICSECGYKETVEDIERTFAIKKKGENIGKRKFYKKY